MIIYNEMAPRKGRHFFFTLHFLLPLVVMVFTTVVFNRWDWDMAIQAKFYHPASGWPLGDVSWAKAIYRFGNIPALIVVLGALFVLLSGYRTQSKYTRYRKLVSYLVLVLIIGPGLLVNSILKDNWGRPRPRDTVQFGGKYSYEAPLVYDASSNGKSFPCGHATMGFYFFALAFVLSVFKKHLFPVFLVFGIFYGAIIGWVRMMQGGHFLSDVLWAGALVYLTAWFIFKAMKLDTNPFYTSNASNAKLKPLHWVLTIFLFVLIIIGVSLANPYSVSQNLNEGGAEAYTMYVDIQSADVVLSFSDSTFVGNQANGHGLPGSKARVSRKVEPNVVRFTQKIKGWFTELSGTVHVVIDSVNTKIAVITVDEGDVSMAIPADFSRNIYVDSPDLIFPLPKSVHGKPAPSNDSTAIIVNASKIRLQNPFKK